MLAYFYFKMCACYTEWVQGGRSTLICRICFLPCSHNYAYQWRCISGMCKPIHHLHYYIFQNHVTEIFWTIYLIYWLLMKLCKLILIQKRFGQIFSRGIVILVLILYRRLKFGTTLLLTYLLCVGGLVPVGWLHSISGTRGLQMQPVFTEAPKSDSQCRYRLSVLNPK